MSAPVASALSKTAKNLAVAKTFTHKYLPKSSHIIREINAKNYKRVKFPNDVFVMMKPGVPLPPDVVVFKVPLHYNKIMIKNYLEELYKVSVKKVNTAIYLGKSRINRFGFYYRRSDYKKAFVRLTEKFSYPGYKLHAQQQKK